MTTCRAAWLSIFLLVGATTSAVAANRLDDESLLNVLRFYLSFNEEDAADWQEERASVKLREGLRAELPDSGSMSFDRRISIAAHSGSTGKIIRYGFIIENALTERGAEFPTNDSYRCEVLVMRQDGDEWEVENLDLVNEYEYEGGTRFAKDCSGFKILWQKGFPVFSREITLGPYMGGKYVKAREVAVRRNGTYRME